MKGQKKFLTTNSIHDNAVTTSFDTIWNQDISQVINLHGLRVNLSAIPEPGPDDASETMHGRWFVFIIPSRVATDTTSRNAFLAQFTANDNTINEYDSTDFIWGSGVYACSDRTGFNMEFAPSTSRNMDTGDQITVRLTKNGQEGAVDNASFECSISGFIST